MLPLNAKTMSGRDGESGGRWQGHACSQSATLTSSEGTSDWVKGTSTRSVRIRREADGHKVGHRPAGGRRKPSPKPSRLRYAVKELRAPDPPAGGALQERITYYLQSVCRPWWNVRFTLSGSGESVRAGRGACATGQMKRRAQRAARRLRAAEAARRRGPPRRLPASRRHTSSPSRRRTRSRRRAARAARARTVRARPQCSRRACRVKARAAVSQRGSRTQPSRLVSRSRGGQGSGRLTARAGWQGEAQGMSRWLSCWRVRRRFEPSGSTE